jgi:hypothetical protein
MTAPCSKEGLMNEICPNAEKCPVFTGILQGKEFTCEVYKSFFCESGKERWEKCRRYQCKQRYGKVPADLLPNDNVSIEEIGIRNSWN